MISGQAIGRYALVDLGDGTPHGRFAHLGDALASVRQQTAHASCAPWRTVALVEFRGVGVEPRVIAEGVLLLALAMFTGPEQTKEFYAAIVARDLDSLHTVDQPVVDWIMGEP